MTLDKIQYFNMSRMYVSHKHVASLYIYNNWEITRRQNQLSVIKIPINMTDISNLNIILALI